MTYCRWSL